MEIKTKKSFNEIIKSLTEEILDEEDLDEITSTANVGPTAIVSPCILSQ